MNAPYPSTRRIVVSATRATVHGQAVVLTARGARAAANEDAAEVPDHRNDPLWLNPLWAITGALALFFALATILLATG